MADPIRTPDGGTLYVVRDKHSAAPHEEQRLATRGDVESACGCAEQAEQVQRFLDKCGEPRIDDSRGAWAQIRRRVGDLSTKLWRAHATLRRIGEQRRETRKWLGAASRTAARFIARSAKGAARDAEHLDTIAELCGMVERNAAEYRQDLRDTVAAALAESQAEVERLKREAADWKIKWSQRKYHEDDAREASNEAREEVERLRADNERLRGVVRAAENVRAERDWCRSDECPMYSVTPHAGNYLTDALDALTNPAQPKQEKP